MNLFGITNQMELLGTYLQMAIWRVNFKYSVVGATVAEW